MNVVCEDIGNPDIKMIEEFHCFLVLFRERGVTLHDEDRFGAAELSYRQF